MPHKEKQISRKTFKYNSKFISMAYDLTFSKCTYKDKRFKLVIDSNNYALIAHEDFDSAVLKYDGSVNHLINQLAWFEDVGGEPRYDAWKSSGSLRKILKRFGPNK